MTIRRLGFAFILALTVSGVHAATRIWDDESGDHLWSNAQNWSANTSPVAGDIASFNESKVGPISVTVSTNVNTIYWTNKFGGQYNVTISSGVTLAPTNVFVCYQAYTSSISIGGGGTFQVGGTDASVFWVGYRLYNSLSAIPTDGRMTLSNVRLNLNKLGIFGAGYNYDNSSQSTYGEVDLTNAIIITDQVETNRFKVADSLYVGYQFAFGLLRLPPTVTNITAAFIHIGPRNQSGTSYSTLDLGESPQLLSLVATSSLWVYRGRIVWSESGVVKTGMPPNVSISVGSPGNPGTLALGFTKGSIAEVRWCGFKGLETYITNLFLGRNQSGTGPSIGELDLQSPNTTRLVGSLASNRVDILNMLIGGPDNGIDYNQQGILKLPRTVTSISTSNLFLGGFGNSSQNSEINLGSNSLLTTFAVSNVFQIGCGNILYTDASGNSRTGFPGNVQLKVGLSPTQRGKLIVRKTIVSYGMIGLANGTQLNGIGQFQAYLNELVVGVSSGNTASASHYGILDLRSCNSILLDVDGPAFIGGCGSKSGANGPTGHGFVYLPAGTVSLGDLTVGGARDPIYGEGELWLSNSVVVVSNAVTIGQTGFVTNQINGQSSGFDLGTPNLSLVASNTTSFNKFGRMVLNFQSDPLNFASPYWGLKVKGPEIAFVQALTNDTAKLTIIKSGLSLVNQQRFGVHYDASGDYTYLGLAPLLDRGSTLAIY